MSLTQTEKNGLRNLYMRQYEHAQPQQVDFWIMQIEIILKDREYKKDIEMKELITQSFKAGFDKGVEQSTSTVGRKL